MQTHIYRRKYVHGSVNSERHQNKKKQCCDAYWGLDLVHLCHQKPNPARETVPFNHNKKLAPECGIIQKCIPSSLENFCHLIYHGRAPKNRSTKRKYQKVAPQSVGFEPTLPEGIWFLVRRLNHSATTASCSVTVCNFTNTCNYLSFILLFISWVTGINSPEVEEDFRSAIYALLSQTGPK